MTQPNSASIRFGMRFQSLGTNHQARKLANQIIESGAVESGDEKFVANFALLLAHTTQVVVDGAHPELGAFREFWNWWMLHKDAQPLDARALWEKRMELIGWRVNALWNQAFTDEQSTPLDAPRELLPDERLNEGEKADPS
jgi:hypothetical protein